MTDTAALSTSYEISIPKALCDARQWRPGQDFAFIPKGDGVLLMPVPTLEALRGLVKGASMAGYRDRSDGG